MFPTYGEAVAGLSNDIEALEQQRLKIVNSYKLHGLIFIIALIVSILGMVFLHDWFLFGIIVSIIYIAIILGINARRRKAFRSQFKHVMVWGLAQQMLKLCKMPFETDRYRYECEYSPKQRISDDVMSESRLFNYSIDKIYGEDLFYGVLGLTTFKFSELHVIQIRETTDSKGNTTRTEETMFKGVLFTADFHKEFSGVTTLKAGHFFNTGAIGKFFQPMRDFTSKFTRDKKRGIELESEEFNKAFDVQTTDDVTARYILSSTMMERLLNFKKSHKGKVEISFVHSSMYVAISSSRDYFEPKLFKPMDEKQGTVVYNDLSFFFGLIEEFDLNTRIWSKE